MRIYDYFAVFDFDGTAAETFKPSLNGVGVSQAYRMACAGIFGHPLGAELYDAVGGLQNRTAGELVAAIFGAGDSTTLIASARTCLHEEGPTLTGYVPPGKGASLEWNERQPLAVITELCVRLKLRILTAQIGMPCEDGSRWPSPCAGFVNFWRALLNVSGSAGVRLVPGIVSSGHDYFIDRCFAMWGLPAPQFKVTDDTMRGPACATIPARERAKPHVWPVRLLCEQWLASRGERFAGDALDVIGGRGFYAGDCPRADGGLAENLGLAFLWFNPERKDPGSLKAKVVNVINWSDLINPLLSDKALDMMSEGLPFAQIVDAVLV